MEKMLNISASPHVRDNASTRRIMLDVIIALIPAAAWGVYHFGFYSLCIMLSCMVFSMLVEGAYQKLTGREVTISDGSAALTGLLLAMNMPPEIPLWIPLIGCAFAILMVKQIFGGLGQNFMNPALAARCFLLIAFTKHMTYFTVDGVSTATPLAVMKEGASGGAALMDVFVGNIGGVIGEVSVPALLIGAAYLIFRGVISIRIPLAYIGSFFIFILLFGGHLSAPDLGQYLLLQLYGGGLILGAFFMATDYVTSPITPKGRIIYGVLLGVLTGLFRVFGSSAEGVSYAIIIGNMVSPLIEKYTPTKAFGIVYDKKEKALAKDAAKNETKKETETSQKHKTPFDVKLNAMIVLTCITLVSGVALGYIYQLTKDTIAQRQEDDTNDAYRTVCPAASEFKEVNSEFSKLIEDADTDFGGITVGSVLDAVDESGKSCGTVINITTHDGYGGDIQLAVGVDTDNAVSGVEILSINETAGLGMNAQSVLVPQYKGKSGRLAVTKDKGEIEAISGATITSRAVTNAVSAALYIAEVK